MEKIILVDGMSCSHCEKVVKDALGKLEEVSKVIVDLENKEVKVQGENLVDKKLEELIEDAGYDVIEIK